MRAHKYNIGTYLYPTYTVSWSTDILFFKWQVNTFSNYCVTWLQLVSTIPKYIHNWYEIILTHLGRIFLVDYVIRVKNVGKFTSSNMNMQYWSLNSYYIYIIILTLRIGLWHTIIIIFTQTFGNFIKYQIKQIRFIFISSL